MQVQLKRFSKKEESVRELKHLANEAHLQAKIVEQCAQDVERSAKNQQSR